MRTSEELRAEAASLRAHAGESDVEADNESAEVSEEYADLIDAVAWWFSIDPRPEGMEYPNDAKDLVAALRTYRARKPKGGCSSCRWKILCAGLWLNLPEREANCDRWEAES